jgi:hypothetical protein
MRGNSRFGAPVILAAQSSLGGGLPRYIPGLENAQAYLGAEQGGVPSFFNHAITDRVYNILFSDKTALRGLLPAVVDYFQLLFEFG